jgi:multiple sugar transport system permease protein
MKALQVRNGNRQFTADARKLQMVLLTGLVAFLAVVFLFPLVLTVSNSFMEESEIHENYGKLSQSVLSENREEGGNSFVNLKLIPDVASIRQYYTVLVKKLKYLFMFWNSVRVVLPIIAGQLAVASMAAYAFAKMDFPGRNKLFFAYIVVMLMPFQVTLVPNYMIADRLGLIDQYGAIILPGIFGTFGVFLLRQFMIYIPNQYSEAARVDGAGHFQIFVRIILPMAKTAVASLAVLLFIDNWNMVEQPLIFLQDESKQPLSVFLSYINESERGIAFAASVVYMAPMLLIFLYAENYLIEGIQLSGLKG